MIPQVPEIYNTGGNTSKYRGDFIGFKFGEETSESLHVMRVSDGSRYNEELLPSFSDKTVQVPGSDQTYYFGADYTNKVFSMEIAFDEMTEKQFVHLSRVFGDKTPKKLILDERPYKYYMAKVSDAPQFKYICFTTIDDEGNEQRIYKGEGTISFVFYYPFARSVHKFLNQFTEEDIYMDMKDEWKKSSRMKDTNTWDEIQHDVLINQNQFNLYNAGDLETQWQLYIPWENGKINANDIGIGTIIDNIPIYISFEEIIKHTYDDSQGILIDSKLKCIRGATYVPSEGIQVNDILYNNTLTKREFFTIPTGNSYFKLKNNIPEGSQIVYDYVYY